MLEQIVSGFLCFKKQIKTEDAIIEAEYEDFYYYYKANGGSQISRTQPLSQKLIYNEKPSIKVSTVGNATMKVNKKNTRGTSKNQKNNSLSTAPYTWLSIPNVTGLKNS